MLSSTNQSILDAIKNYLENNETYTKKEFVDIIKVIYDNNAKNKKKPRKTKEDDGEEKVKKPLNDYQIFMKEQRAIINERESNKEEKMNTREIMKEIAEKWQLKKKGLLEDAKEFLKSDEEGEKKEEKKEEEKTEEERKEDKKGKKKK
jgi:hypothetical protein